MSTPQKISIALPPQITPVLRGAIATERYAPISEVTRDALCDRVLMRSLCQQELTKLRRLRRLAMQGLTPGFSADEVLNRLERKYHAVTDANNIKACGLSYGVLSTT